MAENLLHKARALQKEWIVFRRVLHQNAETGFDLPKTRAYIRERMQKLGLECAEVSGSLVATLQLGDGDDCILLRADTDGLPIAERSGEKFACKTGNMHACGHDMHAAMLFGAACLLQRTSLQRGGKVKFLFQAAEERLEGAKAALAGGVLQNPTVQAAVMLHVMTDSPFPTGTAVIAEGISAPAADYFRIDVTGKGCHGSTPQNGVDALTAAAYCALSVSGLPSREVSVQSPAVLTLGKCTAGEAANVLAEHAVIEGTLRCFDEQTRSFLKQRLTEQPRLIAKAFRARAKTTFTSGCPALSNNVCMSALALAAAQKVVGENALRSSSLAGGEGAKRSGGSEDFAYIAREVPSVMIGLAAGERAKGYDKPLHHARVRFDERAIAFGAALYAQTALEWLRKKGGTACGKKREKADL